MMKCDEARLTMSEYLDDRLSESEVRTLNEHIRTCASCLSYWQALQRVSAVFQTAEAALPAPDFTARLMRRLNAVETAATRAGQRSTAFAWSAVAAGFVVLAAGFILYALGMPVAGQNGPSANFAGLSMDVSNAVLWTVKLAGMVETIGNALSHTIPTPLLVMALVWVVAGTLILSYTVASLIDAYQPRRIARETVKVN